MLSQESIYKSYFKTLTKASRTILLGRNDSYFNFAGMFTLSQLEIFDYFTIGSYPVFGL